jgi:hypothetical protein
MAQLCNGHYGNRCGLDVCVYNSRILHGASAGNLPIEQPTHFRMPASAQTREANWIISHIDGEHLTEPAHTGSLRSCVKKLTRAVQNLFSGKDIAERTGGYPSDFSNRGPFLIHHFD